MELHLLQANYGDAIHLRVSDEEGIFRNILIDGGTKNTYTYLDRDKKKQDGALKKLVKQIREKNEFIDLLIITHIDDDHIGGILQWFADDNKALDLVKKVLFNSGNTIARHFNKKPNAANDLTIQNKDSLNTSIQQGVDFEKFIKDRGIWDEQLVKSGDVIELFGLKFTILSPSENLLSKLLDAWKEKAPVLDTAGQSDYSIPLTDLIANDSFKADKSVPNGSSIAFVVENQKNRLVFAGDALAAPIVDSLKNLGFTTKKPLEAAFVKLSHHGSKGNTNNALLDLVKSENFLVSTDSALHGLPDKRCLARVINKKKKVNLYFNYPELAEKIFSKNDLATFPQVSICSAIEPILIEN